MYCPFLREGVDISYAALLMMKVRLRPMFLSNCLIRAFAEYKLVGEIYKLLIKSLLQLL